MSLKHSAANAANVALAPFNLRLERVRPTTWDKQFREWIRNAEAAGLDPNDIGDAAWGSGDRLQEGLDKYYLPLLNPAAVVLELGPGSGRLTRHVIGGSAKLIAVDFSPAVCKWLRTYLRGKGTFEVHKIDGPSMAMVPASSVDLVLAHGVVEHLELADLSLFFDEFFRVLRPRGSVAFNFNNLAAPDGVKILREQAGSRAPSRYFVHHPAAIQTLGDAAGFSTTEIHPEAGRIAFAVLTKAEA